MAGTTTPAPRTRLAHTIHTWQGHAQAADLIRPFPWYENAPRTEPSQRSHAENRAHRNP